jgi:hypothetical protein
VNYQLSVTDVINMVRKMERPPIIMVTMADALEAQQIEMKRLQAELDRVRQEAFEEGYQARMFEEEMGYGPYEK